MNQNRCTHSLTRSEALQCAQEGVVTQQAEHHPALTGITVHTREGCQGSPGPQREEEMTYGAQALLMVSLG